MTEKNRGQSLIKDFFEGKSVSRPPFILWSTSLGLKVVKHTIMEQLSDPGLIATNVSQCFNLFTPDAIGMGFPFKFPIAACDVSPNPTSVSLDQESRICSAVLEGINRVGITLKNKVALSFSIPGPLAFGEQIRQSLSISPKDDVEMPGILHAIAEVLSKLTSSFLERDIEIIAIVESLKSIHEMHDPILEKAAQLLDTIANIVAYHNKHMIMIINDIPVKNQHFKSLERFDRFDGFLVHHDSCPEVFELQTAVGITIPDEFFDETKDMNQDIEKQKEFLKKFYQGASPFFLSTHHEISDQSSFAALRSFCEVIRGLRQA